MTCRLSFCLLCLALAGQAQADHLDFAITGPTGATNGLPTVTWETVPSINAFEVTLSTDPAGNDVVWSMSSASVFTTNEFRAGPLPKKNYYTFVSAVIDTVRHPANNNGLMFEVNAGSPAPGLNPAGLAPGSEFQLMFVTAFDTLIDVNENVPPFFPFWAGLPAADWTTTFAAHLSGLIDNWNNVDIFYKAVLSIQTETAVDRLDIQAPIYNTNGDLIATGEADLWDGSIANPVGYDEFGNAVPEGTKVWSGTSQIGTTVFDTCGDWNNSSAQATTGTATESNATWISSGLQSCSQPARLYGMSLAITLPDSADFINDDVVDGFDFLTLQRGLGTVGPMATHANGDANGDDFINDADLAVWESQYGSAPPLSAISAAVPEPTTAALALAALCLAMSRRQFRR